MLTLFIIILFAIAYYTGARRGLVLQIVYTVGYMLSLSSAKKYYLVLAKKLELIVPYPSPDPDSKLVFFKSDAFFKLDEAFYAGLAFVLILFIGWAMTRFVGIFFHKFTFFPIIKQVNQLGGGLLSLIVVYVGVFFILYLLSMIPLEIVQNAFRGSDLARMIVDKTPYFSSQVFQWWVTQSGV